MMMEDSGREEGPPVTGEVGELVERLLGNVIDDIQLAEAEYAFESEHYKKFGEDQNAVRRAAAMLERYAAVELLLKLLLIRIDGLSARGRKLTELDSTLAGLVTDARATLSNLPPTEQPS